MSQHRWMGGRHNRNNDRLPVGWVFLFVLSAIWFILWVCTSGA